MPLFEAKGQSARGDLGPRAEGAARAGAADPVCEGGLDALGPPIVYSWQPADALVPLWTGHNLGVPVDPESRDAVALTGLGLPTRVRADGATAFSAEVASYP